MATTPATSGDPGKAVPSPPERTNFEPITTDTGMELEAALPPVAPLELLRPAPASAIREKEPQPSLEHERKEESSAGHLAGSSKATVGEVDAKFARLLQEVHENRPGDDLDVVRRAWAFCLEQHEGQKRASGEPYALHPLEVALVLAELKM